MTYTVHQAKTNLSRLIEEAAQGKEVIIHRGKTPVAKLMAIGNVRKRRQPGSLRGLISAPVLAFAPWSAAELKDWLADESGR
jgi:antitoxin (DNA-binding transcriptional repressor) of toxin-antitoxin stability system